MTVSLRVGATSSSHQSKAKDNERVQSQSMNSYNDQLRLLKLLGRIQQIPHADSKPTAA